MKTLVINCGSSSIKFELFDMESSRSLASGMSERIGDAEGRQIYRLSMPDGTTDELVEHAALNDHNAGLQRIAGWLIESGAIRDANELLAIGHRVAHGGAELTGPTIINEQVIESIRRLFPLAPLHNPASLRGIEVAMQQWPSTPQVAVFDTSFHHTIPKHASQYALPAELAREHSIRRYGFHGTSHRYVTAEAARLLQRPVEEVNLVVLHLGNGASATAVRGGQSIDTSMGMTPLEGLMMGTRCGDVDPGVVLYLAQHLGDSEVGRVLNNESGLKGVCGENDMREVLRRASDGDTRAQLAVEMYAYRIKKYIGAYMAALPRVDAIVFTAGIGEHAAEIRARACSGLQHLGIQIDVERNESRPQGAFAIHAEESELQVWVIPTNEELEMAKQAVECVRQLGPAR